VNTSQCTDVRVLHVDDESGFLDVASTFLERRLSAATETDVSSALSRLDDRSTVS